MFRHILAPLDGSPESERILGWVKVFAGTLGARITLMSVVDMKRIPEPVGAPPGASQPQPEDPAVIGIRAEWRDELDRHTASAESYLRVVAGRIATAGVPVSTHFVVGRPPEAIVKAAQEGQGGDGTDPVDLVAMATRRESALARGILGSVTDRVAHSSPVPVLVVRPDENEHPAPGAAPTTILAPLDVSTQSETAVPVAVGLAKALKARLVFLRVTQHVYYPGLGGGLDHAGSVFFAPQLREESLEYLQPFVEQARSTGVTAEAKARTGNPASRIVEMLDDDPASMAVMASHGLTGFRRLMLGSTTDKVIRASARPVLVVR